MKRPTAFAWLAAGLTGLSLIGSAGAAAAGAPQPPVAAAPSGVELGDLAWKAARVGDWEQSLRILRQLGGEADAGLAPLRESLKHLENNLPAREATRTAEQARLTARLDELLAKEMSPDDLSRALRAAVSLHTYAPGKAEKDAVLASARVQRLVRLADAAAREAEAEGDWLVAANLFARLNILLEEKATYKPEMRRLGERLAMIRLYAPQRLWELRNEQRKAEGLSALPPYNGAGDDFRDRLRGITTGMVRRALTEAASRHVERTPMREMVVGGLESVRTMVTTHDLEVAFPGVVNPDARRAMLEFLEGEITRLRDQRQELSDPGLLNLMDELNMVNARTVQIPPTAVLHEFGNGAFSRLDDFSNIIWPDELARFERMTKGSFIGVGIQIQMDEESQMIKVISPLEGTPAHKAGIKAGDFIKKIDEKPALGMSLDQAVEQITGSPNTKVTLTVERDGQDIEFNLSRSKIPLRTIKGWTRSGARDTDWDWFVDDGARIGYVRISGFNDTTTEELRAAVAEMKRSGLRGLVIDLRFNPGGLLDQAVTVANTFISSGTIVYTELPGGRRNQTEVAEPSRVLLPDVPVVVLINESSASASEIVSGAIRHYADRQQIPALVLGQRSYGKGSVQNVMNLPSGAQMKLTTQYYKLPGGQLIHRRDGATQWGVEPHLKVEMLPRQVAQALTLRQDADLPPDVKPAPPAPRKKADVDDEEIRLEGPADPARLLAEPLDLQLQTAIVLLQAKTAGGRVAQLPPAPPGRNPG